MKQEILRHFQCFLGDNHLVLNRDTIDVYRWPHPTNEKVVVLTTVGMATKQQVIPHGRSCVSPRPRTEIMMLSRLDDVSLLSQLMIDVSAYPKKAHSFVHWWHVIPLGHSIVPDSRLCNLFFTFPPFESQFATLTTEEERVDILWAIAISEDERALFETRGSDVLEQTFEEGNVYVTDLFR